MIVHLLTCEFMPRMSTVSRQPHLPPSLAAWTSDRGCSTSCCAVCSCLTTQLHSEAPRTAPMASSSLLDIIMLQLCWPYQQLNILRLDVVLRFAKPQSSRLEFVVFAVQLLSGWALGQFALELGNLFGHLCGAVALRWQVPLPGGARGWLEPLL
jgi:hypothetical protein